MLNMAIQNKSLREKVYEIIKAKIMTNEFLPGETLSVVSLAEALGASQTPVREAMNMLGAEGLIRYESHRKCLVAPIEYNDVVQAYEVRLLIEPYIAGQAAENINNRKEIKEALGKLLKKAQAILRQPENKVDMEGYLSIDLGLHKTFIEVAGDTLLGEIFNLVGDRSLRIRSYVEAAASKYETTPTPKIHEITNEHIEIITAVYHGKADIAQEQQRRHLINGRARTLDMMKRHQP